jgi:hypothetical protein
MGVVPAAIEHVAPCTVSNLYIRNPRMQFTHGLSIHETRTVNSSRSAVFNFICSADFFKLTGAHAIKISFKTGGKFVLSFPGRGEISGTVAGIIPGEKITGFNRPDEQATTVVISVSGDHETMVSIEHSAILSEESAAAKTSAWREILDKMKKLLER